MKPSLARVLCLAPIFLASPAKGGSLPPSHYRGGSMHGFLVVRSASGKLLGSGDFLQISHGDQLELQLILHFRDGSLHQETTVYEQTPNLRLVSDHLVQHGRFFSKPLDLLLESNGSITSRITQNGKASVERTHQNLPADLSNGMLPSVLINVPAHAPGFQLSYLAPYGKGRLIQLQIQPAHAATFSVAGLRHQAAVYPVHLDLGGVIGVLAPIVGKQPDDLAVWIIEGESPMIVREVGQLAEGGPVVSIEIAGSTFPTANSHP